MTSYNPIFLLQNQLLLSKLGCLQKTRAQNIDIWPNGGHFCDDDDIFEIVENFFFKFIFRPIWKKIEFFFGFWLVGYSSKGLY